MQLNEDGQLVVETLTNKEPASYERLVNKYQMPVIRFLHGLCNDPELAMDLSQDAFFKAWQQLGRLRKPNRYKSWLMQIAYNCFLLDARRKRVEKRHADTIREPATSTPRLETESETQRLLSHVSPQERHLLALCYAAELTFTEVATILNLPVGTVKSRVRRAKAKIASKLAESNVPREKPDE